MQEARDCLTRQLLEALFGKMGAIMERDFARLEANQAVKLNDIKLKLATLRQEVNTLNTKIGELEAKIDNLK